jgi:type IV pilus assembly protein PilB
MSVQFDSEQAKKLEETRRREEEDLVVILSQKYGINHADLRRVPISTEALQLVKEAESRAVEAVPFELDKKKVSLALRTPNTPSVHKMMDDLRGRGYQLTLYMVSRASLEHAWNYYKDINFATETDVGKLNVSDEEVARLLDRLTNLQSTRDAVQETMTLSKQHRVTRILEVVLAGALANGASDIHIEPEAENVGLRFRLDGVLTNIGFVDTDTYKTILVRIKLLSGLKINITGAPQDGRFSVKLSGHEIEIRTSMLPGNYGESMVLRILDPDSISVPLEELGIHPKLLASLMHEIEKPNGMILNTGPTGSGKTTTLYAFLKKVLDPGIKILTIEDPVEYHVKGIVQTQVDHVNYTFASGLRSALRQDPDIIMVGEIRDKEVAETAVQAALTGHLVFSTLHTNSAAGAFPRLVDIGLDPSTVASAVTAVMAQRLLRRLKPNRRKEVPLEGKDREFVERVLNGIKDRSMIPAKVDTVWVPDAPEGELAYKGRVGVYETIFTSKELEEAIRKGVSVREYEAVAHEQGLCNMYEDAVLKVLEGRTTLEEVYRILGDSYEPPTH